MQSDNIAAEISSLQPKREALTKRLDDLIHQFQGELPPVVESWMRRKVEQCIEYNADAVAAMRDDKLKTLKTKLNALIETLPEIVKQETSDKEDWPHYRARKTGYGYNSPRVTGFSGGEEAYFNRIFRQVISHLGSVLDEFGLLTTPKGYVSSWERTAPGKFRFTINPGFEGLPSGILGEFERVYKEFLPIAEALESKQQELAKAKAREKWESI